MTTPASEWLPVAVAARQLAVSERQVWALVAGKKLESLLVGGHRLIDPAAVEARKKKHSGTEVFQFQLQSESLYDRIVRLEKQVEFLQKELKNGR